MRHHIPLIVLLLCCATLFLYITRLFYRYDLLPVRRNAGDFGLGALFAFFGYAFLWALPSWVMLEIYVGVR